MSLYAESDVSGVFILFKRF